MSPLLPFRWPKIMLATTLLGAATVAWTQSAGSRAVTLPDALRRVAEHNPTLQAQAYEERAAEARVEQAARPPAPALEVSLENAFGTGAAGGVRRLEATVQASRTLERGGKRRKRVALADAAREEAAKAYAVLRADVLAAAATAYVQALAGQRRLALAEESLRLAHETLGAVDGRARAGAAPSAEAARARAVVATAETELSRAEGALQAARATLAATWGGAPDDATALVGALRVPESLPNREAAQSRLAAHPRLDLQRSVIAGRRAALELEQAQAAPDVSVAGGVRFLRDGSDAAFVADFSIPMPARNHHQGGIRAARETLAGAEQGVRAVEVELSAAFTAVWQDLSTAHQAARHLRLQALPATEDAGNAVRRAYEQGELPLIDVLDAQRALVGMRREILDAEAQYALALVRLDALTDPAFGGVSTLITAP